MTLTEFLLARIAEDEARARGFEEFPDLGVTTEMSDATATMLGDFGPTRVLAECETKRKIVALYDNDPWYDEMLYQVLMLLAVPYADRPGYDQDWRL